MKKLHKISVLLIIFGLIGLLQGCAPAQQTERSKKDTLSSEEGLWRRLTVYDIDGEIVEQHWGKFDIDASSEGRIKFDIDSQRVMIYRGQNTITCVELPEEEVRLGLEVKTLQNEAEKLKLELEKKELEDKIAEMKKKLGN